MNQDLTLIDTEELLLEVFSRFSSAVFMGIKQDSRNTYVSRGSGLTCDQVGLATMLQARLTQKYLQDVQET